MFVPGIGVALLFGSLNPRPSATTTTPPHQYQADTRRGRPRCPSRRTRSLPWGTTRPADGLHSVPSTTICPARRGMEGRWLMAVRLPWHTSTIHLRDSSAGGLPSLASTHRNGPEQPALRRAAGLCHPRPTVTCTNVSESTAYVPAETYTVACNALSQSSASIPPCPLPLESSSSKS